METRVLLWLDDIRNPSDPVWVNWLAQYSPIEYPFEVVWVKSYNEFTKHISEQGIPAGISWDHDLGKDEQIKLREKGMSKTQARKLVKRSPNYKSGMDCAKFLVKYCMDNKKELPKWSIQSANTVGRDNINGLLLSFLKHTQTNGNH